MHDPLVAALALLPALLLLLAWLRAVPEAPEPPLRVLAVALGGAAAFGVALLAARFAPPTPVDAAAWYQAFSVAAAREELLKLLAVVLIGPSLSRYERLATGLLLAAAAGTGFAAAENVGYAWNLGAGTAVLRSLTAVPAHVLHAALFGVALGSAHRTAGPTQAAVAIAGGLTLSVLAHGVYDFLLLSGGGWRLGVAPLLAAEALLVWAAFRRARAMDRARDVERLLEVPILEGLGAGAARAIASGSRRRNVPPGRPIFREGDPGDALYLILSGELEVRRGEQRIAQLGEGEVVGEHALLRDEPRNADVVALRRSLVLEVPRAALEAELVRHPELAPKLLATAKEHGLVTVQLPTVSQLIRVAEEAEDERSETDRGELRDAFAAVRLFENLSRSRLTDLAEAAWLWRPARDARVVRQNGSGPGLCFVLEGQAVVERDGLEVARLHPGNYFGELGLMTGWPATATVRAVGSLSLAVIGWDQLEGLVGSAPEIGLSLLHTTVQRLGGLSTAQALRGPLKRPFSLPRWLGGGHGLDRIALSPAAEDLRRRFVGLGIVRPSAAEAFARVLQDRSTGPGLQFRPEGAEWVDETEGLPDAIDEFQIRSALGREPALLRFFARELLWSTGR